MKPDSNQTTAQQATRDRPQPLHAAQVADALLKMSTASALAGMAVSTLYRRAADDPTFPKLVKLGKRCTRIRAGDMMAWLASKAEA